MATQGVFSASDVEASLERVALSLQASVSELGGRVLIASEGHPSVGTQLQAVFNVNLAREPDRTLYEIVITHAAAAERAGPGAFNSCITAVLRQFNASKTAVTGQRKSSALGDILGAGARRARCSDVDSVIETYAGSAPDRVKAMIAEALRLAGFGGRIIVEKSDETVKPSVELVRGYTFDQCPAFPLSARLERPRVFCIDGYVEAVSELHHLLEAASESHEPVAVFLRGMSDDVKHTLRVNLDRGSLTVVPIVVRFDLEGMNTLNDVAVVSGCDLVSSAKGDLISSIRFCEAPRVDEVLVYPSKIVVKNRATAVAVADHVRVLRSKRLAEKTEDAGALIDSRIRSLSPNHVVIRLPATSSFVEASQSVDCVLRAVKSIVDHGFVSYRGKEALTATVVAAEVYAARCLNVLLSVGALVKEP